MTDDDEFRRLLLATRTDEAVRSRAGIGARRELAADDATLIGILADLADDRRRVRLSVGGHIVAGVLERVWSDGVALVGPGTRMLVRLEAIDLVTCLDRTRLDGDGRTVERRSWGALVEEHAERGDAVRLTSRCEHLDGTVISTGRDIVVLDVPQGSTCYARTRSIDVVTIAESASFG